MRILIYDFNHYIFENIFHQVTSERKFGRRDDDLNILGAKVLILRSEAVPWNISLMIRDI